MLFLMEQLIVILIFTICAAVCVKIFFASYTMTSESRDTNYALLAAENGAECYKAAGGAAEDTAALLEGIALDGAVSVYYDAVWSPCQADTAVYVMTLSEPESENPDPALIRSQLSVQRLTGEALISFQVTARRDAG